MFLSLLAVTLSLTLSNTYPRAMEIVEIDRDTDTAVCLDATGNIWEFTEPEDLEVGDLVICTLYDNGTKETFKDDEIIDVIWSGYSFEDDELMSVDEIHEKRNEKSTQSEDLVQL